MDMLHHNWRYVCIFNPINAYYLTGTYQEGVLFIQRDEEPIYFVFHSADRAEADTMYCKVVAVEKYEDVANHSSMNNFFPVYIDTSFVTIDMLEEFNEVFRFDKIESCDFEIQRARSIKTKYELNLIRKIASLHKETVEEVMQEAMVEETSELDIARAIYKAFIDKGHQGVIRFANPYYKMPGVSVSFSENALKEYFFKGPSGGIGQYIESPFFGSAKSSLKQNDIVTVSSYFAMHGYNSSLTLCYAYNSLIDYLDKQYRHIVTLREIVLDVLKAGSKVSEVLATIHEKMHPEIQGSFMQIGDSEKISIGSGIGLECDEMPFFDKKNEMPLEENMVVSLSFFTSTVGYGLIGFQNMYIINHDSAECLNSTGDNIKVVAKYL